MSISGEIKRDLVDLTAEICLVLKIGAIMTVTGLVRQICGNYRKLIINNEEII